MTNDEQLFYEEVGRRVRSHRRRADLTQEQLGDEVELARTSITNIEQGNQPVSAWLLSRFASILDCPINDLVPDTADVTRAVPLPSDMPRKAAEVAQRYSAVAS